MSSPAHLGTVFLVLSALVGCGDDPPATRDRSDASREQDVATDAALATADASSRDASLRADASSDASTSSDAQASRECTAHSDCRLDSRTCCACEISSEADVDAVPVDTQDMRCGGIACGPCQQKSFDPLAANIIAACVQGQCVALDARKADLSRCSVDSDCGARSNTCCASCSSSPRAFIAVRSGDHPELACPANPTCTDCLALPAPSAFCAADGHCAIRVSETFGGVPSTDCISPTQALASAFTNSTHGCDCVEGTERVCATNPQGNRVGLVCSVPTGGGTARWADTSFAGCP